MNIKKFVNRLGIYLILILICIFFAVVTKPFLTAKNLLNVGRQVSMIGICSVGMTMVLLTGGIDISVGALIALVSVIAAKMMVQGSIPIIVSVLAAVLIGTSCGFFVGFMITQFKVPALIATLAMQTIARGVAFILTGGMPIFGLPEGMSFLGQGYVLGIPFPLIMMTILFIFGYWLLEHTAFGRHIYAIGGNIEVARLSGINVNRRLRQVYALSGLFASISGIIMLSRINSGQPAVSEGFEMDVITGTVLGGVSVAGGEGKIINVVAGVFVMAVLSNGMVLLGMDEYWQRIVKGIVLFAAVSIDNIQKNRKG